MIEIKSLNSSSSGNCYIVSDGKASLLLECGIPIKMIKRGLNFKMSQVSGCLVTHGHKDHCLAVGDLIKHGIDVYMSEGTAESVLPHWRREYLAHIIQAGEQFNIGPWIIMPFETQHDCQGSLGFLISDGAGEKIFFATDTAYIRNTFSGLTRIMVECNYDLDSLDENLRSERIVQTQYNRIIATHFGLEQVVTFLKANDLSRVKSIHLLHLSSGNSNENLILKTIRWLTGVPVIACAE